MSCRTTPERPVGTPGARGMPRRDFVRRLPVVTAGLAGGLTTFSLTACAGTPYVTPTPQPQGLVFPLDALSADGDAFVQTADMDRPVYVRRGESGAWTAVLASCTHRGCQPEPVAERLVCPCHGSEFSLEGEVLQGPADRPLTRYDVVEDGGRLTIRTDRNDA